MQSYRSDIDGLRTLAVFGVILFHADLPYLTGGFLGVDVFLVISGFLITRILIDNAENNKFSFMEFYSRRFRRIYPALLTMITIISVVNLFIMVPYDLKNFGQSVVASLLSANNILLYLTSGYWSTAAEFKPLYHTWTLAVEEQYYIVIPFLIYIVYKIKSKNKSSLLFYILCSILIASFISCYIFQNNREFAFLMLFSRAWELLVGAIAAILYKKINTNSNRLSTLGLLMIILSYFYITENNFHPGLITLFPVIGTTLIILFNRNSNNLLFRLLSIKPMVFMGLISYSLYLWHQPVFAGIRLVSQEKPQTLYFLIAIIPIIVISYLSWRFIEKPFRSNTSISEKKSLSILLIWSITLIFYGLILHTTYGFQNYFKKFTYEGNPQDYVDQAYRYQHKELGSILILGDSFSRDMINALNTIGVDDIKYYSYTCNTVDIFNKHDLIEDVKRANLVIVSSLWADPDKNFKVELASLDTCFSKLRKLNTNSYIIGTKNFGYNNNFVRLISERLVNDNLTVKPVHTYLEFDKLAKENFGDRYISIIDLIKNTNDEVPLFYQDKFISYDNKHLTPAGARFIANKVILKSQLMNYLK